MQTYIYIYKLSVLYTQLLTYIITHMSYKHFKYSILNTEIFYVHLLLPPLPHLAAQARYLGIILHYLSFWTLTWNPPVNPFTLIHPLFFASTTQSKLPFSLLDHRNMFPDFPASIFMLLITFHIKPSAFLYLLTTYYS